MRLLTTKKVLDKIGLSRATLYRLLETGEFPTHTKVQGVNLWVEAEIDEWIKFHLEHRRVFESAPTTPTA